MPPHMYHFEGYTLDTARCSLRTGDRVVELRPRAFEVLRYLVENAGRLVTKEEFIKAIWPDVVVTDESLTHCVSEARQAIGDERQAIIRTVPRRGYQFVAPVSRASPDNGPEPQSAPARPSRGSASDRTPPGKPSIAVLPFTNIGGDPEQEYFADGMVEEIITALSRFSGLLVIARNSSFAYKGRSVDVKQAGRELGVRYVLEGSVRKAASRVRVTGQVIEAETGRHVWADRYDRTLDDVFAIQDELTMSVVAAIEPSLRQAEIERVKRKRPDNLDAYDLVLRAIPHVYPAMPDGAAKALPLLERALEMEPDYALAHGFAAWSHEILFARAGARAENRLGATRHAHAAIAHGRDDAISLSLGGFALGMVAHDREAARQAFDAALALSPSCALAYTFGSVVTVLGGDSERGIEWGEGRSV